MHARKVPPTKQVAFIVDGEPRGGFELVRTRAVARWSFAVRVFRAFGGSRQFNPVVVVFRPLRRVTTLVSRAVQGFLEPFKAWKHGDRGPVERLREELASLLSAS
jgi:hypothetical protein